jgi:small GTP-binding protein
MPAGDALRADLGAVADLARGPDRDEVAELRRRLDTGAFRVLVAGEAKRGKSTLVNALLGRPVLPTGVVPLTAVPTTVTYGEADRVAVSYLDGRTAECGLAALTELVTEEGNRGNVSGVATVSVQLPAPLLRNGLELVDTPGTGSVFEHNTAAAVTALTRMDAAIFVVSADPPVSASERALLRQLRMGAVALFCVLNKVDYLQPDERSRIQQFTEKVIGTEVAGDVRVWPVSAREGLAGRLRGDDRAVEASGLSAFEAAFTGYLTERQDADLVRSVAGRAARLAVGIAEETDATLAALALSAHDLEQRLGMFEDRLAQVQRGRAESAAVAVAEFDRLLADTNEQAAALTRAAAGPLQRAVQTCVANLAGPAAVVEQQALEDAAARIRALVDDWRHRHGEDLDSAVRALDERLTERLDDHIAAVRRTAAELFELELAPLPAVGRFAASARFSYAFAADPGQTEALAAAIRSRLPGRLGRRAVARHVTERAVQLLDRQVGRARADFQDRLAATQRDLLRELDRRFDTGAGRLSDAVRRAQALHAEHGDTAARVRAELETRRAAATAVGERVTTSSAGATTGRSDV